MIATISQLKNWFSRGYIPTQNQYHDWIDSFFHKSESVPAAAIDGLQDLLDQKQDLGTGYSVTMVGVNEQTVMVGMNLVLAMEIAEPMPGLMYEFELWYNTGKPAPVGDFKCIIKDNPNTPGLKLGIANQTANQFTILKGKLTYYNDSWRGIMEMHSTNSSDIMMADFELNDPSKIEIMVESAHVAIVQNAFIKKVN